MENHSQIILDAFIGWTCCHYKLNRDSINGLNIYINVKFIIKFLSFNTLIETASITADEGSLFIRFNSIR